MNQTRSMMNLTKGDYTTLCMLSDNYVNAKGDKVAKGID